MRNYVSMLILPSDEDLTGIAVVDDAFGIRIIVKVREIWTHKFLLEMGVFFREDHSSQAVLLVPNVWKSVLNECDDIVFVGNVVWSVLQCCRSLHHQ